jgi:hypothetical protein
MPSEMYLASAALEVSPRGIERTSASTKKSFSSEESPRRFRCNGQKVSEYLVDLVLTASTFAGAYRVLAAKPISIQAWFYRSLGRMDNGEGTIELMLIRIFMTTPTK